MNIKLPVETKIKFLLFVTLYISNFFVVQGHIYKQLQYKV